MTGLEKFGNERAGIRQALMDAGIAQVMYNKDDIPKDLPAAIVILDGETGRNGTARRYVDTEIAWTVYLIVNASKADDPDADLYALKEKFREKYQAAMYRDIPEIEYYTSRVDGARLVRVARLALLRSGTGAGS
ncbi:MAG TPA: hypothetical protein P5533_06645 [Candidatus Cloacimonadota bacterium]|nr:hypothetical protein [Candidatus Cloacimonadota bacterium]